MRNRGLRRSFADFRRHPWLHFVSISTISVALLLLGVFFLCYRNFETIADKTKSQNVGTVYLKEGLAPVTVDRLKEQILSLPGVRKTTFKTKHSVMEDLQSFLGAATSENLPGSELFPDVIEVEIKKEATSEELTDLKVMIAKVPEVSDVDFSDDWLAQFKKIRHLFNIFGLILTGGIVVGCGFIIAN